MKFATDQKSHMDGVYFTEERNSTINDHWQLKKKKHYGHRFGKVVNECSQYCL